MSSPGTLTWFAHHEFRLAWRDWLHMVTAGRRRRERTVAIALLLLIAFMHFVAYSMVGRFAHVGVDADKSVLLAITVSLLLSWSLLLSQAMESATRAFYARSDLDLILSSPAAARKVFAVRIAAMALSIIVIATLLASPFINVLVVYGGLRWLAAYGVVASMGATAAALAVALTVALFRALGPKRTRLVAQIVAAVIGATFVIGLQIAAILSYGDFSRYSILEADWLVALAPDPGSIVWWPARAVLGDFTALAAVLSVGLILLGAAIAIFSVRFGEHAMAAASVSFAVTQRQCAAARFRSVSQMQALRRKEWTLLKRDPWLISQSLMQILYLLPPALFLWLTLGKESDGYIVVVPALVMAAGQLAGGLAWLAISGEDAPDLVATAPIPAGWVIRAKVEAVLGVIALVCAPLVAVLALASPWHGLIAAIGIAVSAASATAVQLWFRTQAKRSHFRRRQVSSRMATFAEAFSSITWAATAALAAAGTWLAVITGVIAVGILIGTRLLSPHKA